MGLALTSSDDRFPSVCRSYGGFHDFRKRIAKCNGIDLDDMVGFGGSTEWSSDDLRPFLDHSDSEGTIRWQDCGALHDTLEIILDSVEYASALTADGCDVNAELSYGVSLLDLLRYCYQHEKDVVFQ